MISMLLADLSFHLGFYELIIVFSCGMVVAGIVWRTGRRWLLGFTLCWLASALLTPADPLSTLLVGGLLSVLYLVSMLAWLAAKRKQIERSS